jgi:hypothetical protein
MGEQCPMLSQFVSCPIALHPVVSELSFDTYATYVT